MGRVAGYARKVRRISKRWVNQRARPFVHDTGVAARKHVLQRPDRHRHLVNIGGGRWFVPRWENVDFYAPWPYVDVRMDLRDLPTLPYPDGSCGAVFCSHVLEHLPDDAVRHALREMARVLAPDGVVRISVPDLEAAFAAYEAGDESFFEDGGVRCVGPTIEQKLVNYFASYRLDGYSGGPVVEPEVVRAKIAELGRLGFAAWCAEQIPTEAEYRAHVNAYDATRLIGLGAEAGLALERSAYGGSRVPAMRGPDFDNRPRVSLFVEGGRSA